MKRCCLIIFFLMLTGTLSLLCKAQNSEPLPAEAPYQVTRITGDITFDGIPDEAAWELINAVPLTMNRPAFGESPTEKSIIKIAYDDEYFYASAWLFYQNPANAARNDGAIKNDLLIDSDINFSWNTFWDAETVMHENVWTVEVRVPLSSFRFQSVEGKTQMGIILMRSAAAKNETVTWPVISPDFIYPFWKPSLGKLIEFEGLEPKKPVYVMPYVTAGIGQVNQLNDPGTGYDMHSTFKKDAGLDVKFSLSNNLITDLTINTDFAQVEADNQMDRVKFPERSIEFTNHILRLNDRMTLTTKTSLSAFVQYNTEIDGIIGNIRFRYNPRDGNDLYLVYDEGLNFNRIRETPALPLSAGRTVLLKYTYTFRL